MAEKLYDCYEIAKVPVSSASTSSSSNESIINRNQGKQGDVVTGVGGDVIKDIHGDVFKDIHGDVIKDIHGDVFKDIHGDVFKDIHVQGDFNYGEKKIRLPRFVMLKANYDGKCLRLTKNKGAYPAGILKFEGREVASPEAKFELVTAQTGNGLVHIRCCFNNKYLVRSDTTCWIVAAADEPEENKSKISCTLFELEQVNKSEGLEFQFHHIQRGKYASSYRCLRSTDEIPFHGRLCVGTDHREDVYTVVAWESLVKKMNNMVVLPRFVALKGMNNNKYLTLTTKNYPNLLVGFLRFDGEDVSSPLAKFEMEMAKSENGLVHIRCCGNNKYLVRQNTGCPGSCYYNKYLIVAAADKPEEDEYKISCTLFEPVSYDESGGLKFRFRHLHRGIYASMWRNIHSLNHSGLYGGSNAPDIDACDVYTVVDLKG